MTTPPVSLRVHAPHGGIAPAVGLAMLVLASGPATLRAQSAPPPAAPAAVRHPAFDPTEKSLTELQDAMTSGKATSTQLTDAYLARIAAYDHAGPALNAMIRLNPRARADAAALDAERTAGRVRGPMHGIPIVLKDNYDTRDLATSAGSLALASHVPAADAFVVTKLREAGAVILGKTNLHELASGVTSISSLGGQTLNPYDLSRCPGGSSGGTGAAVAASFAAVGWGTDTCGSIRIPSAFGSLFGLRPTQGTVSRDGIVPLALTQDVAGPLARTATDLAIALDVTVGADPNDPQTRAIVGRAMPKFRDSLRTDALRGARIGIFRPYFRDADGDVADTIRAAAQSMRALGAEVIEVNMPDFDEVISGTRAILMETRFDLVDYFNRPGGSPVKSLGEIIEKGLFDKALEARHKSADTATAKDSEGHRRMIARQALLRARMIAFMDSLKLDALAYPTSVRKPVLAGDPQLGSTCALSSQSGLPAISMPAGFTSDGLPTGLELLGRPFSDVRLVAYAYAFEQAGPRRRPPPTTPALLAGRAPQPVTFTTSAGPATGTATARFSFNPLTSELSYVARLSGTRTANVTAVVIRRADPPRNGAAINTRGPSRVIKRVLGPEMTSASGVVRLLGDDLDAFRAGRLSLAVFGNADADPIAEVKVEAPTAATVATAPRRR
jgi:Asp-tRNA(Asn)/Glu-tRNA(Gln) amidotransferase A subunit family amidase